MSDFYSDKVRALLAYLVLEPHEYTRAELAALLWPEIGDQSARANLRNTLHRLRQTLDAAAPGSSNSLLTVSRQSICFNPEHVTVDVHDFLAAVRNAHSASSAPDLDQLEAAAALYRGELLAGFGVADAPAFEEWLLLHRELLHQQALVAVHRLATAYEADGHYESAHTVAGRLLILDPFHEETHRQIMRLLARMGQPERALAQLERLRQLLREEMGVDPDATTLALAQQIAAGEFGREQDDKMTRWQDDTGFPTPAQPATLSHPHPVISSSPHLVIPSSRLDLSEIPKPGVFFGRAPERRQIAQWLVQERCQVVAILGIGGMGKTTLVAQCIREFAGDGDNPFAALYWRSLVNAPTLDELLPPLLQALSHQQLTQIPAQVDEQLRLLLGYLRDRRVLLVLDNMESILEPSEAGAYRPGYAPYGQLIQQVATLQHHSHLVLTSRERPRGYDRLERGGYPVRSLALAGLDNEAGRQLFRQRGLQGDGNQAALLMARYSGNPLALKLVADTVDEIFGGDIAEFLADDTLIFDDVRKVLDQHFARLTDWGQQILYWLAIEREVTSLATLQNNFLNPPPQRVLLETLRNLQRHTLVERQEGGFVLQNVVTEYLTERLIEEVCHEIESGNCHRLYSHALLKAQAKESVRQSQARLLLQPIAEQMKDRLGLPALQAQLSWLIDRLRTETTTMPSYAGGNLFNLLVQLEVELTGYDFSHLHLWQAHLQGVSLWNVNFANADLTGSTFTQPFGTVPSTAISPDGRLFASGAESGAITIWQLRDYQPIMILEGHTSNVSKLAFSPDGRRLASSSIDATIGLWDCASGQLIWRIEGRQPLVYCVAFSPDGRWLVSGGAGSYVHLWDPDTAALVCQLAVEPDSVTRSVAFHPAGTMIGAANLNGYIFLWNIAHLTQAAGDPAQAATEIPRYTISTAEADRFFALSFSRDGTRFACGTNEGVIRVWDTQTRQLLHTLRGHEAVVRSVEFSPDGSTLVSASFDNTVRVWDVAREQCDAISAHERAVWSASLSPDGQTLVSSGGDSIIRIWQLHPSRRIEMIKMLYGYRCIISDAAFSPVDPLLAVGDSVGTIRLWDIGQEQPNHIHTLQAHDLVETLAFSPNGRYLASAGGIYNHAIQLWDITTKQCLARLQGHTQRVRTLTFAPDGTHLASAGEDATIRLWNVRNPSDCRCDNVLQEHQNTVYNLTFNANGALFASSSEDQTIRIWETVTGRELQRLVGLGGNEMLAFSPAADILACSAGHSGNARLLELSNLPTVKQLLTLSGHTHEPVSGAFGPDGKRLVTGSSDSSVRLWDIQQGKQIYVIDKHKTYVKLVKFSPKGQYLFSTSFDGVAYLWDAASGRCIQTFHAPHPYQGMNITGVTGISETQRAALKALGAVEASP
ncbi:MAG: NACHT domain-containing protein [Caldilineaceae bacterium]|nr:NACHT domain-containing protein [Caldilineaceae bacterium]MCB0139425.1 NACHT domain-containing protein [Caldilineaceae bacterium]